MPGYDRTGPIGNGQRTGRGLGKCRPGNQVKEGIELSDISEKNSLMCSPKRGRAFRDGNRRRMKNRGNNE